MKKPTINRIVIILIVLLAGALYFLYAPSHHKQKTITIGNIPIEGPALLYIAEERGFFKRHGLKVTIRDYETGPAAIEALLSGNVDIASSAEYPLVRMAFEKEKIQIIASINKSNTEYLVARKDHGIKIIDDIKAKRIGLPRGTMPEFYLGRFLSLHGMKISDVTIVDMSLARSGDVLSEGRVDAIVDWQPHTDQVIERLGENAVAWPIQNNRESFGLLSAKKDWIASNTSAVTMLLRALSDAEAYAARHTIAAKSIVQNKMNFTYAYMNKVWQQNRFYLTIDQSLIAAMEDEARWMIKNKLTKERTVPDFTKYIYINSLKEVKPDAVNIVR